MKRQRIWIAFLLFLVSACLLTSCGNVGEENAALRARTEEMLDALLRDDMAACHALVENAVSIEDFTSVYLEWREMLSGVESYELRQTSWHTRIEHGVTQTTLGFLMKTNAESYVIEVAEISTMEGFCSFYITPSDMLRATGTVLNMGGANAVQWIFLLISLAEIAFVVWAVVDCCRHRVAKKVLWIIIILLGVMTWSLTVAGSGVRLNVNVGLITNYTALLLYGTGEMVIRFMAPIGAIIYLTQRRRLFAAGESAEAVTQDDGSDDPVL